jgi:hypothetical protein
VRQQIAVKGDEIRALKAAKADKAALEVGSSGGGERG